MPGICLHRLPWSPTSRMLQQTRHQKLSWSDITSWCACIWAPGLPLRKDDLSFLETEFFYKLLSLWSVLLGNSDWLSW